MQRFYFNRIFLHCGTSSSSSSVKDWSSFTVTTRSQVFPGALKLNKQNIGVAFKSSMRVHFVLQKKSLVLKSHLLPLI